MRRAGGVVLVSLLLVLAACGGSDDSSDEASASAPDEDEDEDEGQEDDEDDGGSVFADLLGAIPDDGDLAGFVVLNDLTAAFEANDLDPPDEDDSGDEVADALAALTVRAEGVVPRVSPIAGGLTIDQAAVESELGFNFGDVEADAVAGLPPEQLQLVMGDFDPDRIEAAVEADPIWNDALEEGEIDGVTVYSWLDDGEVSIEHVSETRPIGESARLAVLDDDLLAWARNDEAIEAVIDPDETLGDRDDLPELAAAIEDAGAVSAVLSADEADGAPDGFAPYEAVAVAGGVDDDGDPLLFLALWHEEEDDAEENVDQLVDYVEDQEGGQFWPQLIPVDVDQEGRVVLGTYRIEHASEWWSVALTGDPVFSAGTAG